MTPEKFRRKRKDAAMTQANLAVKMGVSTRAVQYWEAGGRRITKPTRLLQAYVILNHLSRC